MAYEEMFTGELRAELTQEVAMRDYYRQGVRRSTTLAEEADNKNRRNETTATIREIRTELRRRGALS